MVFIGICDKVKIIGKNKLPEKYKEFHGQTAKIMNIKEGRFFLDVDKEQNPWREWMFNAI